MTGKNAGIKRWESNSHKASDFVQFQASREYMWVHGVGKGTGGRPTGGRVWSWRSNSSRMGCAYLLLSLLPSSEAQLPIGRIKTGCRESVYILKTSKGVHGGKQKMRQQKLRSTIWSQLWGCFDLVPIWPHPSHFTHHPSDSWDNAGNIYRMNLTSEAVFCRAHVVVRL